ncbi:MAG: SPASM domain-containing protein [Candidatus Omnitrophica bacterium]|nr:SPASM domain-containing protein [Candidatus Omnitrophota bacterium]
MATPERAKSVIDAGLDSVKFSVNAGTRESYKKVHGKDDFEKVIEHIKWFDSYRKENNIKLGIYYSMVPTKITKGEWPLLQEILGPYTDDEDLRGCSNQGGNMYENNYTEEVDKNNLLGSLSRDQFCGKCPDPFFRATITPQGFLTTCVVDYQNYLCVADLREESLKDAWHNEHFVNLRKRHIANDLKGLICHNCLGNCNDPAEPLIKEFSRPFKK